MKNRKLITATLVCLLVLLLGVIGLTACSEKTCIHGWSEWSVTTEPTCTEAGVRQRTCQFCSKVEQTQLATLSHDWSEATCTEPKLCKTCGATEGEAPGHIGGVANCQQKAVCTLCGAEHGEKNPDNHTALNAWSPADVATHTAVCADCSNTVVSEHVWDENGCTLCGYDCAHTWSNWLANGDGTHTKTCTKNAAHQITESCSGGEATCTDKAVCELCHTGYGADPVHTWDAGTQTKAPTCLEAGKSTYTCLACSTTKEESIAAPGHNMTDAVTAPTCTAKGYTTHTCQNEGCSVSYTDTEVDALDHDWNGVKDCENGRACRREGCHATEEALGHNYTETGSTAADCDEAATKTYTCQREGCGDTYADTVGDPHGHSISGVTPTRVLKENETCVYVQVYECTACHEDVAGTEVTNHTYKAAITSPATCVVPGVKTITCADCGDHYTEAIPNDATGHDWESGTVAEGSNLRTDTCKICSATKSVTVYTGTTTDQTAASDLADKEVELNGTNISLGSDVTNAIGQQTSSNITLSAGKTEGEDREQLGLTAEELKQVGNNPIYDFTIKDADGNPISQFGENNYVTITLPYTLVEGEDVDNIAVWFINDEGKLESIKATYNNGYVTFKTNHFSYYTVTRLTPQQRCELYDHAFTTKTVEGDCLNDSYTLAVCARCHKTEKTVTVEADGHSYECVTTPATCTANGKNVYTCADCGASYETKINATGHAWAETENVAASCAAPGHVTKTCQNQGCDAAETVTYAQLKHVFTDSVVAPTCEAYGYTLHDCDSCDYSYTDTEVAATGHSYTAAFAWRGITSATATLTCINDATHSLALEATVSARVIESTCPAGNRTEYTAKVVYNGVAYTDVSATQSGNGEHQYTIPKYDEKEHWNACICGAKADVTAHVWGDPKITKPATCGADGESVATCTCGATKAEAIPATGQHVFGEPQITKPATCGADGESVATCACGKTETAVIPATGEHSYVNGACTVCGATESNPADCDHAELEEVSYDFADYGACGGILTPGHCKDCGTLFVTEELEDQLLCDIDIDEEYEEGINEAGNPYMWARGTCEDCGLVVEIDAEAIADGCQITATYINTISMNGEAVLTATYVDSMVDHDSEQVTIDLSEYSTCGGSLSINRCTKCDTVTYVNNMRQGCDGDNTVEEQVEIDGITYMIATLDCPDCDLKFVAKQWNEYESVCEYSTFASLDVYNGETQILTYAGEVDWESEHEYEYSYVMNGDKCEDGWTATVYCPKCEYTRTYQGDDHATESIEIDLTDYGFACGGKGYLYRCRNCDYEKLYHISYNNCSWSTQGTDEEGYTISVCTRCDVMRQSKYVQSEKDENCIYSVSNVSIYLKDGTEILRYEENYSSASHTYEYSYQFATDSKNCEDGVTVTSTCKDCGHSYANQYHYHNRPYKYLDLAKLGACGESKAWMDVCPCGAEGSVTWRLDCQYSLEQSTYTENGIVHTVYTYTCADCGLVITDDHYTVTDQCTTYTYHTVSLSVGETEVLKDESYRTAQYDHTWKYDYTLYGDSCEDGVDVTKTCTACGEFSKSYYTYHNSMTAYYDLADYGACGGYIEVSGCACRQSYGTWYELDCTYSTTQNTYTDDNGVEHTVYTYTCADCKLVVTRDSYRAQEGCYYSTYYIISASINGTVIVENAKGRNIHYSEHDYEYSYVMNGNSCEDGVEINRNCKKCGESSNGYYDEHYTLPKETYDLTEYGACEGKLMISECPCGAQNDVYLSNTCAHSGNWDSYLDEDKILHNVSVNHCETCGLRYQCDSYAVRDAKTCTKTTYSTVTVSVDITNVAALQYQSTEEAHNYTVTGKLINGEGSSCDDGVELTYTCKDCGYSYTYHNYGHYTFEQERIDLAAYGSVCGGYIVKEQCACGESIHMDLENALCDLDRQSCKLWIDNVVYSWDAYIYTCSVTDPTQCGLKIRYASYYLQEADSCLAYRYETWQFGYNEQDGTWQHEVTFKTDDYTTRHTETQTDLSGEWEGGTYNGYTRVCSVCGSSTTQMYYNDVNGNRVKFEYTSINTLDTANTRRYEEVYEYAWYTNAAGKALRYTTRHYEKRVYADGSEYWYEYNYTYDFTNGCQRTTVYTDSDGNYDSTVEEAHSDDYVRVGVKTPTCTQSGISGYRCSMCEQIYGQWTSSPTEHDWVDVADDLYFCSDCGLQNANGATGDIVLEDLTAAYGNGTDYVIGYYNTSGAQFTYYVSLITEDGKEIFIDVEITEHSDLRALVFSKAAVQAAATEQGLAEGSYDLRFAFVPYGADATLDYAITLTEDGEITEITEDVYFVQQLDAGETVSVTVSPAESGKWIFDAFADQSVYLELFDGEGSSMTDSSWDSYLVCELEAGKTYTLQISWFYGSASTGYLLLDAALA